MARKALDPSPGIATPGNTDTGKLKLASLNKVDSKGFITDENSSGLGIFLLNPDSYEDNKTSNWVAHNIPGQSDPIMQWVSGGIRTVSFEALVTKDTSYYTTLTNNPFNAIKAQAITAVGGIASALAGVNVPTSFLANLGNTANSNENKLDISDQLNYYRSLLYPEYNTANTTLAKSPPLLVLYVGNTLGSSTIGGPGHGLQINEDTDVWVLTDLNIKISKQLATLAPMEATVGFKLSQYVIKPRSGSNVG